MLINPGAELTLLAPTEAAFQLLGFNFSMLPAANVSMQLAQTWVLKQPVSTSASATAEFVAPSLLGHNVTFGAGVNGANQTEVVFNGTASRVIQADIPACRSWVHLIDSVLLEL